LSFADIKITANGICCIGTPGGGTILKRWIKVKQRQLSIQKASVVTTRAVESESEGILGGAGVRFGVGVGKNVPTPTPNSV
jgi:hypothetical protein